MPRWPWVHLSDGAAAEGLRSVSFTCARGGWAGACGGCSGCSGSGPRTRCARDALRPAGRWPGASRPSAVHAACFQIQTKCHTTGDFGACNRMQMACVSGVFKMKAKQLASAGRVLGWWCPKCVRWGASSGFPGRGGSPETCALCPGLRGDCRWPPARRTHLGEPGRCLQTTHSGQ